MLIPWLKPLYESDDPPAPQGGKASAVLSEYSGDAIRMAEKLAEFQTDNYKLREKNRTLTQERDALAGKVPADGARILTAEEGAALDAYLALGKPDELKTALTERTALAEKVSIRERADLLSKAALAAGFDPDVLAQLVGAQPVAVKDDKDKKPVAYIADTEGTEHPLADYAAQHWTKFLPALAPAAKGDGVGSPANGKRPAGGAIDVPSPNIRI